VKHTSILPKNVPYVKCTITNALFISIIKLTRCTIFEFIEYHSTCFGRSFLSSSGVQDCTHSIRYMSYRLDEFLLAGTKWNEFHLVPASKPSTNLYDIYLMLCI